MIYNYVIYILIFENEKKKLSRNNLMQFYKKLLIFTLIYISEFTFKYVAVQYNRTIRSALL